MRAGQSAPLVCVCLVYMFMVVWMNRLARHDTYPHHHATPRYTTSCHTGDKVELPTVVETTNAAKIGLLLEGKLDAIQVRRARASSAFPRLCCQRRRTDLLATNTNKTKTKTKHRSTTRRSRSRWPWPRRGSRPSSCPSVPPWATRRSVRWSVGRSDDGCCRGRGLFVYRSGASITVAPAIHPKPHPTPSP